MTKKILIVEGMENDFVCGSLGSDRAKGIIVNVGRLVNKYKEDNNTIVFTKNTNNDVCSTTSGERKLSTEGIKDCKIVSELNTDGCMVIDKPTFGYSDWKEVLDDIIDNPDDVVITVVGLNTDTCVVSNALILKSLYPNAKIVVIADCCAGISQEGHNAALTVMRACQIDIVDNLMNKAV